MKGSKRNNKCPCGSEKKWKNCCPDKEFSDKKENDENIISEAPPVEVLEFFKKIQQDNNVLASLGIKRSHQQTIIRTRDSYSLSLGNGIFEIKSDEVLSFYEVIGVVAMDTLGDDWIEEESKKPVQNRSEIYKIISVLGATDSFKKIISYTGKKIKTDKHIPSSGFSKNFLTLAFDIFCLRHQGQLPDYLVKRLKNFNEYQGARYEITVAAMFCRLGYDIEWYDETKNDEKHCEFIAKKNGQEIYVEAKSRRISGVHNERGEFNEDKANNSVGYGGLLNDALQKKIPEGKPYFVFIDINAVNEGKIPKWIERARKTLTTQHLKKYLGKEAPFTAIVFTNYAYHYQGLNPAGGHYCFMYENDLTSRPYSSSEEKIDILNAGKYYGIVPDYYIAPPMTILQSATEQPVINNMNEIIRILQRRA